jgi:cation:H+ antiporter
MLRGRGMIYVLAFATSGLVVVLAASSLARYADAIASATKLGRVWIGSVLLAAATSLPELTTDITAVRLGAIDLAAGDLFGSSMANMLILAIIDLMPPRRHVLRHATFDHAIAACLAIAVNGLAAVLVLLRSESALLWVGPGSLLLLLAYLVGTRAVYWHSVRDAAPPSDGEVVARPERPSMPLRRALSGFALAALVVLAAAPALAWSAKGLAAISGLGNTFVGTLLVGLATSAPELVACIAAVRMGSLDLAIGNLFGSNVFNMAIFFILDLVQPGSLFAALDPSHAVSGLFAVVLMSLGLMAIVYRAKRRLAVLEPNSFLMVVVYIAAIWMLYDHVGRTP